MLFFICQQINRKKRPHTSKNTFFLHSFLIIIHPGQFRHQVLGSGMPGRILPLSPASEYPPVMRTAPPDLWISAALWGLAGTALAVPAEFEPAGSGPVMSVPAGSGPEAQPALWPKERWSPAPAPCPMLCWAWSFPCPAGHNRSPACPHTRSQTAAWQPHKACSHIRGNRPIYRWNRQSWISSWHHESRSRR